MERYILTNFPPPWLHRKILRDSNLRPKKCQQKGKHDTRNQPITKRLHKLESDRLKLLKMTHLQKRKPQSDGRSLRNYQQRTVTSRKSPTQSVATRLGRGRAAAMKVKMQRCGFLSEFAKASWLNFLKSDNGLEDRHRPTIGDAIICKKDMAQDILLIFMDRVAVTLIIEGKGTNLNGRWCNPCKWVNNGIEITTRPLTKISCKR